MRCSKPQYDEINQLRVMPLKRQWKWLTVGLCMLRSFMPLSKSYGHEKSRIRLDRNIVSLSLNKARLMEFMMSRMAAGQK